LMGDNLAKLPEAVSLAKRTVKIMRQNIVIALSTVVALLAGVFVGGVTMSFGMLVHGGSVLLVILNAMRLMRNAAALSTSSTPDSGSRSTAPEPVCLHARYEPPIVPRPLISPTCWVRRVVLTTQTER